MGVVVCYAPNGSDLDALRDKYKAAAAKGRGVLISCIDGYIK